MTTTRETEKTGQEQAAGADALRLLALGVAADFGAIRAAEIAGTITPERADHLRDEVHRAEALAVIAMVEAERRRTVHEAGHAAAALDLSTDKPRDPLRDARMLLHLGALQVLKTCRHNARRTELVADFQAAMNAAWPLLGGKGPAPRMEAIWQTYWEARTGRPVAESLMGARHDDVLVDEQPGPGVNTGSTAAEVAAVALRGRSSPRSEQGGQ